MSSHAGSRHRQIGRIFVERGLVTEEQLAHALARQQASGEVLGEILVEQQSITRMQLADVLGEQWHEISAAPPRPGADEGAELRELLDEARAAREHLVFLSAELGGRMAALEELVAGVNERLGALQRG